MQALDSEIIDKIYEKMDVLDSETLYNSADYNLRCVSVFDRLLTEEESEQQIFFYQYAVDQGKTAESERYFTRHDQLVNFYLEIYRRTTVFGVLSGRAIVKFDTIEEYKSHVLLSVREQLFLKILLPEFCSVIEGNFDLQHLLYTLKSEPKMEKMIILIIKESRLFVSDLILPRD